MNVTDQTPYSLAKYILDQYNWYGKTLEPARGDGAFYNQLNWEKDWCEIKEGKDFFSYNDKVDNIVTNPPFRENGKNLFVPFLEHSFELAQNKVVILINDKCFSALTPTRLEGYLPWRITKIEIVSVKIWRGRYYHLCFDKVGTQVVHFNKNNWK